MNQQIKLEMCIDAVDSAVAAQEGGADRVELCDNLLEGGTTPSAGAIAIARRKIDIGLNVMIRPRGGDFCYSDIEFEVMKYDVEQAKQLGADGVVFGLLDENGSVDAQRTKLLIDLARPLSVTFHRAFDMTCNAFQALEDLVKLGVDRVLTSGQENSVLEGLDLIAALVRQAGDRIIIMPGGGITERNIGKIVAQSGVKEVHAVGTRSADSSMQHRNSHVFMGGELRPPEFTRLVTDADRVKALRQAAR